MDFLRLHLLAGLEANTSGAPGGRGSQRAPGAVEEDGGGGRACSARGVVLRDSTSLSAWGAETSSALRCGRRTRWVGSVRCECLDRLLIVGRRQLEHILRVYVRHYTDGGPTAPSTCSRPEIDPVVERRVSVITVDLMA